MNSRTWCQRSPGLRGHVFSQQFFKYRIETIPLKYLTMHMFSSPTPIYQWLPAVSTGPQVRSFFIYKIKLKCVPHLLISYTLCTTQTLYCTSVLAWSFKSLLFIVIIITKYRWDIHSTKCRGKLDTGTIHDIFRVVPRSIPLHFVYYI